MLRRLDNHTQDQLVHLSNELLAHESVGTCTSRICEQQRLCRDCANAGSVGGGLRGRERLCRLDNHTIALVYVLFAYANCEGSVETVQMQGLYPYQKYFLKFAYIFKNAGIGWSFNNLNVLCQITFPPCTLSDMDQ